MCPHSICEDLDLHPGGRDEGIQVTLLANFLDLRRIINDYLKDEYIISRLHSRLHELDVHRRWESVSRQDPTLVPKVHDPGYWHCLFRARSSPRNNRGCEPAQGWSWDSPPGMQDFPAEH